MTELTEMERMRATTEKRGREGEVERRRWEERTEDEWKMTTPFRKRTADSSLGIDRKLASRNRIVCVTPDT